MFKKVVVGFLALGALILLSLAVVNIAQGKVSTLKTKLYTLRGTIQSIDLGDNSMTITASSNVKGKGVVKGSSQKIMLDNASVRRLMPVTITKGKKSTTVCRWANVSKDKLAVNDTVIVRASSQNDVLTANSIQASSSGCRWGGGGGGSGY